MKARGSTLHGKKTYIVAGVTIAYLIGCQIAKARPDETILGILGSLMAAALRSGMHSTQGSNR